MIGTIRALVYSFLGCFCARRIDNARTSHCCDLSGNCLGRLDDQLGSNVWSRQRSCSELPREDLPQLQVATAAQCR